MFFIGIDIGTTSICGVLYDSAHDQVVEELHGENSFLQGGGFRQDPEEIVRISRNLLDGLIEGAGPEGEANRGHEESGRPQIGGIGISSQMHGILYVDREGKAVSPFYTWKNEWGYESYREGKSYAEYLSEQTGMDLYSGYGSVTHFYLQRRGMIPEEAVAFVNIGDYFAMKLAGVKILPADVTIAASFGGFGLKKRQFALSVMETAGVDVSYYPEVVEEKVAGNYQGVPVVCAVGDNQTSFLGAVKDKKRSVSVNVGTGSQVSVFSEELYETGKGEVRPFPGGGWLYVGASVNGGKGEAAVRENGEEETTAMTSGIFGLKEENFHVSDLIRGFVSGMARELYGLYQGFPEGLRRGKTGITASGNGIRKNPLLKEGIEKIYKLPEAFADRVEEAATGVAIWAETLIRKEKGSHEK